MAGKWKGATVPLLTFTPGGIPAKPGDCRDDCRKVSKAIPYRPQTLPECLRRAGIVLHYIVCAGLP